MVVIFSVELFKEDKIVFYPKKKRKERKKEKQWIGWTSCAPLKETQEGCRQAESQFLLQLPTRVLQGSCFSPKQCYLFRIGFLEGFVYKLRQLLVICMKSLVYVESNSSHVWCEITGSTYLFRYQQHSSSLAKLLVLTCVVLWGNCSRQRLVLGKLWRITLRND